MDASKRIGILGGAFNPIHLGHLLIAENAREQFGLDEIWLIPSGRSPHKSSLELLDASHRMKMLQLAVKDQEYFKVNDCEINSDGINYTYLTVSKLAKQYPHYHFYFIMGADSLFLFEHWKNPKIICKHCSILAAVRDNINEAELEAQILHLKKVLHAQIHALATPNFYVSSHEIRNRVQRSSTVKYLVPKAVEEYIYKNGLYQYENRTN